MKTDYSKHRGKCKELAEAAVKANPRLTLVRGHYWCPIWNTNEPHWWALHPSGQVVDPTRKQFPSKGMGEYIPFDGVVCCSECGKEGMEEEFTYESNYAFCSGACYGKFVGVL